MIRHEPTPTSDPNAAKRRFGRGPRRLRAVAVLPTLFTLGNLVCGFFAIAVTSRIHKPERAEIPVTQSIFQQQSWSLDSTDPTHNMMLAGWLIFIAMIFDALDGHVARLTKASSQFGAQLDSLCDAVTFGVAPGLLLVKMVPSFEYYYSGALWIIAAVYASCAVLRLARFNVETGDNDDHSTFQGLPSPAAAASIAGFAILFYTLRVETSQSDWTRSVDNVVQHLLPFFALIVALLMVSRIPYPHVVNRMFRGKKSFGHLVGLIFSIVAIAMIRGYAVPIVSCAFVFGPLLMFAWRRWREPEPDPQSLF
jgi:CDP-diacylglycerol--serine O-phosphatidyltransferase